MVGRCRRRRAGSWIRVRDTLRVTVCDKSAIIVTHLSTPSVLSSSPSRTASTSPPSSRTALPTPPRSPLSCVPCRRCAASLSAMDEDVGRTHLMRQGCVGAALPHNSRRLPTASRTRSSRPLRTLSQIKQRLCAYDRSSRRADLGSFCTSGSLSPLVLPRDTSRRALFYGNLAQPRPSFRPAKILWNTHRIPARCGTRIRGVCPGCPVHVSCIARASPVYVPQSALATPPDLACVCLRRTPAHGGSHLYIPFRPNSSGRFPGALRSRGASIDKSRQSLGDLPVLRRRTSGIAPKYKGQLRTHLQSLSFCPHRPRTGVLPFSQRAAHHLRSPLP